MFKLCSKFKVAGDQEKAINSLAEGIQIGLKNQVLLGATGTGKTFTMANIIQKINRPTLIIAHNKTLAAQLCNEFREFFPENRVEYFVSYYDFYQPEAYMVSSDTYIEKDMSINEEIDKLRSSATASLMERDDVIVVASVSCIYGLGAPEEYWNLQVSLRVGDVVDRNTIISKLIDIQYKRSDLDALRSTFRVKGDSIDIFPSYTSDYCIRVEFDFDEIVAIKQINPLTGANYCSLSHMSVFPATHYVVGSEKLQNALKQIENDKDERVEFFLNDEKFIESQRIKERASYDIEMMREIGYCNGIENYSRYFDGRSIGEPPFTLLDYFPKNFVTFIDESHATIPQIKAMYNGDRARKTNLVDYGFRLPSAFDNRPLKFEEFEKRIKQTIFVSATPADYEKENSDNIAEQIIRPTGLLDPIIEIKPTKHQVDELIDEILNTTKNGYRVLVTTLTKKMAETLTEFLASKNIKVRYLHSEIDTMERIEILNALRSGEFDVLVGINLLREGLDLPEVELVCILDADKEGFLRSNSSLIQTIGRASRNANGRVVMFADSITKSMDYAIRETQRRRQIQMEYNKRHNIVPKTIIKEIKNTLEITKKESAKEKKEDKLQKIDKMESMMKIAAKQLDFETAIKLRDEIAKLKK